MKKTKQKKKTPLPTLISKALRKIWLFSDHRREALRSAKSSLGFYLCAECRFPAKAPAVDHIVPVGSAPGLRGGETANWHDFIGRLFCPPAGLQVLCEPCHHAKGLRDNLEKRTLDKK